MKATKNGWTVEGTPREIAELIGAAPANTLPPYETRPIGGITNAIRHEQEKVDKRLEECKKLEKEADSTRRKGSIDWPKADSLKAAGWSFKAIAEELGTTYQTVYSHFNPAKKPGKEE